MWVGNIPLGMGRIILKILDRLCICCKKESRCTIAAANMLEFARIDIYGDNPDTKDICIYKIGDMVHNQAYEIYWRHKYIQQ